MAVNLNISVSLLGREYSVNDLNVARAEHGLDYPGTLRSADHATGTVDYQQDRIWSDTRTLAATSESLDFANSLNPAIQGSLITMVEIRGIYVRNRSNAPLILGNAASPAYSGLFGAGAHTITVPSNGVLLWHAPMDGGGLVVTGGTNDQLKFDAGASTVTYDVVVWGVSA